MVRAPGPLQSKNTNFALFFCRNAIAHPFAHSPYAATAVAVLFLGTEKYPEEGEFENFLTQHGGSSNAVSSGLSHSNEP